MLEAGKVNGKQIDKNVILDVKEEDSKSIPLLIQKSEMILEETKFYRKRCSRKNTNIKV